MKQALQLKLGQQLALTPQLQQAIKLLQLSTVDLQQTIEETLESNALLERESDASGQEDLDFSEAAPDEDGNDDLAVDTAWEDALPSSAPPIASTPTDTDTTRKGKLGRHAISHGRPPPAHTRRTIFVGTVVMEI
jgi:RNA polymerase sigma-54 factor